MTGKGILRQLEQQGYTNVVGEPEEEFDLADGTQVDTLVSE